MIRNSPIESRNLSTATAKLATCGSQLINSASTAVAQGTQLSNVVTSRAVARAEEVVAHVRSPDKMERTSKGGRARVRGIRDRINKFDSTSKSNLEYHSITPFGNRKNRDGNRTGRGRSRGGGGHENRVPLVPPPCNHNVCGKENESYRDSSDPSLISKEGGTQSTPTFKWKKNRHSREEVVSHPVNHRYRENEAESATRDEWKRNETETERSESRESRNGHDSRRADDLRLAFTKGGDLVDFNFAAVMRGSRSNDSNMNANSNSNANAYGVQRSKRRGKANHPLISSSLWKHTRGVHDSACSNPACTILKDPFPLLPPECTNPLAVVANWEERKGQGEGCPGGGSNSGISHLGTLGLVTGTWKGGGVGSERGGVAADGGCSGGDGRGKKNGEEAVLDLLTSAAFLFKQSRRNLA